MRIYVDSAAYIFLSYWKEIGKKAKTVRSCITCPRGQSITQNPLLHLLILNTAGASKKVDQV